VLSKRITLPESKAMSSGAQMASGGVMLLIGALIIGEFNRPLHVSMHAAVALAYLIIAGSLVGFTAFVWLLYRMSSTKVTSYAYVNPVVALAIGYWLGGESIHSNTLIGSLLVLVSVVIILTRESGTPVEKKAEA
jgi:drug/metabolite transporter (DMT)-like permease